MAGQFELIDDLDRGYRVRLLDTTGKVLAVSERYDDKESAARGIYAIREIAASGLIESAVQLRIFRRVRVPKGPHP